MSDIETAPTPEAPMPTVRQFAKTIHRVIGTIRGEVVQLATLTSPNIRKEQLSRVDDGLDAIMQECNSVIMRRPMPTDDELDVEDLDENGN